MKGWNLRNVSQAGAVLAAFAVVVASPARAQSSPPGGALPSAERMLQVFEEDAVENRTGGTEGIAAVQWALMHQAQVDPAKLDSVLAGLERPGPLPAHARPAVSGGERGSVLHPPILSRRLEDGRSVLARGAWSE